MEEPQREKISRLADFEFELPAEFVANGACDPGTDSPRSAFTPKRLDDLNRYIQHVARTVR